MVLTSTIVGMYNGYGMKESKTTSRCTARYRSGSTIFPLSPRRTAHTEKIRWKDVSTGNSMETKKNTDGASVRPSSTSPFLLLFSFLSLSFLIRFFIFSCRLAPLQMEGENIHACRKKSRSNVVGWKERKRSVDVGMHGANYTLFLRCEVLHAHKWFYHDFAKKPACK